MPETSSSVRSRANLCVSISDSQLRKRGQALVHIVQPFWPCVQSSGPPSMSRWNGR